MARHFLILFGLLFSSAIFCNENNEPVFQYLGKEKLGVNSAYSQCWDSSGGMWMASEEGLVFYDGYVSKIFSHIDGDVNTPLINTVRSIYIDTRSDIWICYNGRTGLSRYSIAKNSFTHYLPDSTRSDAFPDAVVSAFKEDRKGNLWITTWGGGLVKVNLDAGTFKSYQENASNPSDRHSIPCNVVKGICELDDGRFLLGFFLENKPNSLPVYFDPVKELFTPFPLEDFLKNTDPVEADYIRAAIKIDNFIHVDKNYNIWFGTYSCLIFFDTHRKTAARITGKKIVDKQNNLDNARAFVTDEYGNFWIVTPHSGLMIVNPDTRQVRYVIHHAEQKSGLADNHLLMIKKDAEENIWVSSQLGVFSIYNPMIQQFDLCAWENMNLDFSNRSEQVIPVNQMLVNPQGMIYASSENGISIYDPAHHQLKGLIDPKKEKQNFPALNKISRVKNFKSLNNGKILAISPDNLLLIDTNNQSATRPENNNSDTIRVDRMHLLFRHNSYQERLVCYEFYGRYKRNTLWEYMPQTNRVEPFAIINGTELKETYSFVLPDQRWMIAAGEREFVILNPADKSYQIFGPDHPDHYFPDSTITSARLLPNGEIWIGSQHGLYRFDYKTGKSEKMNAEIGIGEETVFTTITDKQNIVWIAMAKDILMWDRANKITFRFNTEMGLNSGVFLPSVAQTDNAGRIYIASANGVVVFDPAKIVLPKLVPQLFLSQITIGEDTLSAERLRAFANGKTELAWNENFLNFEIRSNQIYTPTPHRLYYRMIGIDTSWQDNGISNKIRFTNLSHGEYILEVKIRNTYGKESKIFRVPFVINRPFWTSWWFVSLMILLAIASVILIIRYRERASRVYKEKLEKEIRERTAEVVEKAEKVQQQKEIIEEKNKELTDSIHYALRIQRSILPEANTISKGLPEHFIFYRPKDIVSGDFYWYSQHADAILWAVADCTGHGVPGGFMSMLGSGLLNQIVNEEMITQPAEILNRLRDRVISALKQKGNFGESTDGMDISLCSYIPSSGKLIYSGANTPLYIGRNSEISSLRADKQPIGIFAGISKPFSQQEIQLEKGDMIFMSSDGYSDQFGGPKGKKFKTSNFVRLLNEIQSSPIVAQGEKLEQEFISWKGNFEQVDDICVFGVRI